MWRKIEFQLEFNFVPHVPTNILIFVIIELLDAKTEKSMHPIKLYIYI